MKSRTLVKDAKGYVSLSGPALKNRYRAAPPEGKNLGKATKGK